MAKGGEREFLWGRETLQSRSLGLWPFTTRARLARLVGQRPLLDGCAGTTIQSSPSLMPRLTALAMLERARAAETPVLRAKYATGGLSQPRLETDTQVLLLRQLYLAHLERERYAEARAVAEQMVAVGDLSDVALHDASRACALLGDVPSAAKHLLTASRSGPTSRRAFHLSCLGSLYFHANEAAKAARVLLRAVRWATSERALYKGQLALVLHALGDAVDIAAAFDELNAMRRNSGYADYVLGELALRTGRPKFGTSKLLSFIAQVEASSVGIQCGLRRETERAKELLQLSSESK